MTLNLLTSTEFCTKCGSLVSLPIFGDYIDCFRCMQKTPLDEYDFRPISTKKLYQEKKEWIEDYKAAHSVLAKGEKFDQEEHTDFDLELPKIDQQCVNEECDSGVCFYYTQQTRSADEGQTIFFRCVKCE